MKDGRVGGSAFDCSVQRGKGCDVAVYRCSVAADFNVRFRYSHDDRTERALAPSSSCYCVL